MAKKRDVVKEPQKSLKEKRMEKKIKKEASIVKKKRKK
jgi:hypothetical protein